MYVPVSVWDGGQAPQIMTDGHKATAAHFWTLQERISDFQTFHFHSRSILFSCELLRLEPNSFHHAFNSGPTATGVSKLLQSLGKPFVPKRAAQTFL